MVKGRVQNETIVYASNEHSFKWGKYDFPLDAVWGVMDFTHGMCYGLFNKDVNSHHVYQRVMERLFTKELLYRWKNPHKLVLGTLFIKISRKKLYSDSMTVEVRN